MIKSTRIVTRVSKAFWIWCEFSVNDTKFLTEIQKFVHKNLESPKFKIHLTLAGPFKIMEETTVKKIKELSNNISSLKIKTIKYSFQEEFFKSLFISVNHSDEINFLRKKIFELNKMKPNLDFFPHISLAYGNHSEEEKEFLIQSLPILNECITIDKISIVNVNENIYLWEIVNRFNLNK